MCRGSVVCTYGLSTTSHEREVAGSVCGRTQVPPRWGCAESRLACLSVFECTDERNNIIVSDAGRCKSRSSALQQSDDFLRKSLNIYSVYSKRSVCMHIRTIKAIDDGHCYNVLQQPHRLPTPQTGLVINSIHFVALMACRTALD
jgi:hypothetical protein